MVLAVTAGMRKTQQIIEGGGRYITIFSLFKRSSDAFMSLFKDEPIPYEEMVEIEGRLTTLENNIAATKEILERWKMQLNLIKKLLGDLELNILESRKESFMMELGNFNRNTTLNESLEKEDLEDTP